MVISDGWRLSDGFIDAVALGCPAPVLDALIEVGLAPDPSIGLNCLASEWVGLRRWRYENSFEMSPEPDVRYQLRLRESAGECAIYLNDELVSRVSGDRFSVDLTGRVAEGKNLLALEYSRDLPRGGGLTPIELGASGPVEIKATWCATVMSAACRAGDMTAEVELKVYADVEGEFVFECEAESEGGETVLRSNARAMSRGQNVISLECDMKVDCGEVVTVRAMYAGALCDEVAVRPELACRGTMRTVDMSGAAFMRRRGIDELALALGADSACGGAVSQGLSSALEGEDAEAICFPALPEGEKLERLAGDEEYWPPSTASIWKLRSACDPQMEELERVFGRLPDSPAKVAQLSRYWQAERVRRAALAARVAGRQAVVREVVERAPYICSGALVEHDGVLRPAYFALRDAWRGISVGALLPPDGSAKAGEVIELPVWAFSDTDRGIYSARATVYDMEGRALAAASYPVSLSPGSLAGNMALTLPECECALIVRVELAAREGDTLARSDYVLAVEGVGSPLAAWRSLPRADLKLAGREVINEGGVAALCVSAGDGCQNYAALLPGEGMSMDMGAGASAGWLNSMSLR